eukprot:2686381-Pyramimonas_sp.AAC.1
MIAAFAAVDTMLITDRQKGLLNLVSYERLVRKGLRYREGLPQRQQPRRLEPPQGCQELEVE